MTNKNILILILLTVVTLGLFWVFHFIKLKKTKKVNSNLSFSSRIPFSIKKLVGALTLENIIKSEYTQMKVKIFVKSTKEINVEDLKKIKSISGSFMTSDSITIIVGNSAKTISNQINQLSINKI